MCNNIIVLILDFQRPFLGYPSPPVSVGFLRNWQKEMERSSATDRKAPKPSQTGFFACLSRVFKRNFTAVRSILAVARILAVIQEKSIFSWLPKTQSCATS
jgi:hypothetical protein